MKLSDFEEHVGTKFLVASDDSTVEMQLVEATDKTPKGFRGEQFSLIFEGPIDRPLEQQIYAVEHGVLGRQDIFLVPIGQNVSVRIYEAFFNRLAAD